MQMFTQNSSTKSFVDGGHDKEQNLQAACEALAGLVPSTEGLGTWGNSNALTVSDTRITVNSIIIGFTVFGTQQAAGSWRVTSRAAGSFVLTSTETETSGTTFWYIVINKS